MTETTEVQVQAEARRAKRRHRRRLAKQIKTGVLVLVGLGLLAAIVLSLLPKPIDVVLGEARNGPMRVTVDEDGKTRAKNRYVLSAPLGGNMNRIHLQAGDHVQEGTAILRIVPAAPPLLDERTKANARTRLAAAKAAFELAGAEVARATAALDQAKLESAKAEKLNQAGVVSLDEVERTAFALRARQEELRAAEFSSKVRRQDEASARAALGFFDKKSGGDEGLDISAPVSGEVLRVLRQDQQGLVAAGAPLLEIADLSDMEIVADILTADAVHIQPGAMTRVVRWGGSEDLVGRVNRVEPSAFTRVSALGVEEQRVLVIIDIDSPREKWKSLGDGYRVEVEISIWEASDALTVPASAVFRHEGAWAVYRAEGGVARLTPVEVGHRNDLRVEILQGLSPGSKVVAHPSDQVVDGVEISESS